MISARTLSSRWFRRALPAAFALCMAAFFGPSAEASCGDWLEGHAAPGVHERALVNGPGPASDAAPLRLPGNRPCNGPSCGRSPHVPLVPSEAPAASPDLERDAIIVAPPVDASAAPRRLVAVDDLSLPSAVSGRPERPPRAV